MATGIVQRPGGVLDALQSLAANVSPLPKLTLGFTFADGANDGLVHAEEEQPHVALMAPF